MEKFKDFFYDKNDIVVALIIIVVAALIINGRVTAIMDYPRVLAAEIAQNQANEDQGTTATPPSADASKGNQNTDTAVPPESPTAPVTPAKPTPPAPTPAKPAPAPSKPASGDTVTCVIPSGASSDKIAQILVDAGVVSSKSDFLNAVTAANADKKLKAGTFRIPVGATVGEVIGIVGK